MNLGYDGYFTLIGSLPYLPEPDRAERLPINRQRFETRFAMLDPVEARELEIASDLLLWERSSSFATDAEVVSRYDWTLHELTQPGLRNFLEHWMDMRTVLAALRRQQRGEGSPAEGEAWGVGSRVRWIERNWDKPDFWLGAVYPWIEPARQILADDNVAELQRLQTNLLWKVLTRIAESDPFSFEAVFAYKFKWHLLDRWLSRDPEEATNRFRQLVEEVSHELN